MTNRGQTPSRNERREHARELARQTREAEQKRKRRNRFVIQGSIGAAVVAIIVVIALVVVNGPAAAPSAGPANMISDGVVVADASGSAAAVTTAAIKPDAKPVATEPRPDAANIVVYLDYLCPYCGQFEKTNGEQINTWVESGVATVETHPISILDRLSAGTRYSTRAANTAACTANLEPDSFLAVNAALFANQPAENSKGLSDDELISLAGTAGVEGAKFEKCVTDETFSNWVEAATTRATDGPLPNSDIPSLQSTPTVIVNGTSYTGSPDDPQAFSDFVTGLIAATPTE